MARAWTGWACLLTAAVTVPARADNVRGAAPPPPSADKPAGRAVAPSHEADALPRRGEAPILAEGRSPDAARKAPATRESRPDAPADLPAAAPASARGASADGLRAEVEAVVFLVQYVGGDYPNAVEAGAIRSEEEYREVSGFVAEARRRLAGLLDGDPGRETARPVLSRLADLEGLVTGKADARRVEACADEILRGLTERFRIVSFPRRAPDAARAAALFAANCATCHGAHGAGDGPSAAALNPKPAPFADPAFLDGLAPYQAYNAITQGVSGTAMPSFRSALRDDGARWDLAYYLWTLDPREAPAQPPASLAAPVREQVLKSTRALAEEMLSGRWGAKASGPDEALAWARWLRRHPAPEILPAERVLLLQERLDRLWEGFASCGGASPDAGRREALANEVTNLYLAEFEPLESVLDTRDRAARVEAEAALADFREALRSGDRAAAERARGEALGALDRARASLGAGPQGGPFAALQSATIILREGAEAALLVALILTALGRANRADLRRYVFLGIGLALTAGAATWGVAETLLGGRFIRREALEGSVSLLAAVVLMCVTFWLIRRADVAWWTAHLKSRMGEGLRRGSGWVLAGVTFLAVYREAFETVLFYQALALQTAPGPVLAGFAAGAAALVFSVAVILRLGVKVPLRVFFGATSVVLVALAFVFVGDGIHALQLSGVFPLTPGWRRAGVAWLGIHPTVETTAAQGALLALFAAGFALRRRLGPAHARPVGSPAAALAQRPERIPS